MQSCPARGWLAGRLSVALQRLHQRLIAGQRAHGIGQPAGGASTVMPCVATASSITRRMASTSAGFSSGIMRRSSFEAHCPGTTLVLVPPPIQPTFRMRGWLMPSTWGAPIGTVRYRCIERVQDRHRALQRVDATGKSRHGPSLAVQWSPPSAGSRCAPSPPVAEADGDHQVGRTTRWRSRRPGPSRRRTLVVGEQQLHRAAYGRATASSARSEGVGREIGLADRGCSAA